MAKQSSGGSRGVLGEIDSRLAQVERELEGHTELLAERERLIRARAAMTGEPAVKQISVEDVTAFLVEHPGHGRGRSPRGSACPPDGCLRTYSEASATASSVARAAGTCASQPAAAAVDDRPPSSRLAGPPRQASRPARRARASACERRPAARMARRAIRGARDPTGAAIGPRGADRPAHRRAAARRGLVQVVRILVGEAAWVIPTTAGIRAAGYGFPGWRPRVGLLAHVAAVNEVRLHIQSRSPETEWVSERAARARAHGRRAPAGRARYRRWSAGRDRGRADGQEPAARRGDPRRALGPLRRGRLLLRSRPAPSAERSSRGQRALATLERARAASQHPRHDHDGRATAAPGVRPAPRAVARSRSTSVTVRLLGAGRR